MQLKGHTMGFWHTRWCQLRDGKIRIFLKQRHCTENRKEQGMVRVTELRQIAMDKDTRNGLYFHLTAQDGVTYSFYTVEAETGKLWLDDIKKSIACEQEKRQLEAEERRREASEARPPDTQSPRLIQDEADVVGQGEALDWQPETGVEENNMTEGPPRRTLLLLLFLLTAMAAVFCMPRWLSQPASMEGSEDSLVHDSVDL